MEKSLFVVNRLFLFLVDRLIDGEKWHADDAGLNGFMLIFYFTTD